MDYRAKYQDWCSRELEDPDLTADLAAIAGNDREIYERFYTDLVFGTAGLRGILGAGTNRMNLYTVRRASLGLADYIKRLGPKGSVAIAYDSRIKSRFFAVAAAEVLAANGIAVWLSDEILPTPILSWAVRYYRCTGGIVITASHNPAEYNGFKVYGPDGCQLTTEAADMVYSSMINTPIFGGSAPISIEEAQKKGMVRTIEKRAVEDYYKAVFAAAPQPISLDGLTVAFTPLNGSGMKYVEHVLKKAGLKNLHVVKEQAMPDGNFPTCRYPNPESPDAMQLGLKLAKSVGADLLIGTDPDADRVGVAVLRGDNYSLLSGNEVGILLIDYFGRQLKAGGAMPADPVVIKSIVSSPMADLVAASHGMKVMDVLTGFKNVGELMARLEEDGQLGRFVFAYEESCGYLPGSYVRDKDAVAASLLVAQMAAWHKQNGKNLSDAMDELYSHFGWHHDRVDSLACPGADGLKDMQNIMNRLFDNLPSTIGGIPVLEVRDYRAGQSIRGGVAAPIELERSDVLIFLLKDAQRLIIRPSGTEPKLKIYSMASAGDMKTARRKTAALFEACGKLLEMPEKL